jgi:hypothetical protein
VGLDFPEIQIQLPNGDTMSDSDTSGFGKFVPGFDFLQSLAKGASTSLPQMPGLGSWVAPTLNPEELEKRIDELKAVHFWLEQNSRALAATIQALEVQKMTLATLKGMNVNMGDMANAFKRKAADSVVAAAKPEAEASAEPEVVAKPTTSGKAASDNKATTGVSGLVDPLQLWGSLTQQFQQIAAGAMKKATSKTTTAAARKAVTKRAPAKTAKPKTAPAKTARKKPTAR